MFYYHCIGPVIASALFLSSGRECYSANRLRLERTRADFKDAALVAAAHLSSR